MNNPHDMRVDTDRALTYHRGDTTGRVRADGWIWKQATGTATAGETSFAFDDDIPADSYVEDVAVIVSGTSMTAATTVALGYSGTTGAFMTASSFGSTMNAAGAKAATVIPAHLTAAKTPLITFSADLDTGAKVLCGIRYRPVPAIV
jgi:hypothetical protein